MHASRRAGRFRTATLGVLALSMLAFSGASVVASRAQAAAWMQVSCVNADQSPASSEGWTGAGVGGISVGSTNNANCAPGVPMYAALSMQSPAAAASNEYLAYTPPAGSTLIGGSLLVGLQANGFGFRAAATAAMFTPAFSYDATNVFLQCVAILAACQNGLSEYYGVVNVPANRGGSLYLGAGCAAQVAGSAVYCTNGGSRGVWSSVAVSSANLLLSSAAQPTATDFHGSVLVAGGAHGTANLAFTAADTGPGVYKVVVTLGTKQIYNATPNTNAGKCAAVGTDTASGALMFDYQQPCPTTVAVDVPVRTTTVGDGAQELKVTVTDAAQTVSTVLRQTITVNNRTTVSSSGTSSLDAVLADGPAAVSPLYAVVLDPATQALGRRVHSAFTRSGLSLSGTLQNSNGVPAAGVPVRLIAQNRGDSAANVVASATSDAAGHWVLSAPLGPSRTLTIVTGEQSATTAGAVTIAQKVKPKLTLKARALGHGRLKFTGRLVIAPLGSPRPLVVVQARNGTRWQAVGSAVRVSASGAYKLVYNGGPNVIGQSYVFRVVAPSTQLFVTATSPIRRTRVH